MSTESKKKDGVQAPAQKKYQKPTGPELKKKLTPLSYNVTQQCGTEPAFNNAYYNTKKKGIYVDVVTGEPLFSSHDKYDSGTGWPSFTKPIDSTAVTTKKEESLSDSRTDVKRTNGQSHLGHLFNDGPAAKGGLRYCINSAALRFIPVKDLEKEGYGQYRTLFE